VVERQRPAGVWSRRAAILAIAALTPAAYLVFGGGGIAQAVPAATAQYTGGIADVAVDQEPPCLRPYSVACSLSITTKIASLPLPGAYRIKPDFTFEPRLVQSVAAGRTSLTYTLKPEAEWNDGVPVSADDLIFTFQTIMNPANDILDRSGYDLITQAVKVDAKTVRFHLSTTYAPWRTLFPHVLPKHVLEGHDYDTVWSSLSAGITDPDTGLAIGSGPFLFDVYFALDNRVELTRNLNWWGPTEVHLSEIFVRFQPSVDTRVAWVSSGVVEVIDEQTASLQAATLYAEPEVVADWYSRGAIEHIVFNTASATMPLLQQPWFRQAVAHALDRATSVPAVYGTVAPGLGPHQSLAYLSQQPEYKQNFAGYAFNATTVANLMTSHGCVLGGDGIWVCNGNQRASLRFATTTGNVARAQMQDQLQAQADAAGIELLDDNSTIGVLVGTRLPAGDFDLAMFSFVASDTVPFGLASLFGCGGDLNFSDYCHQAATAYMRAADRELSPSYRAFLMNRADHSLAAGLPAIPLFQYPSILAYHETMNGVVANAGSVGVFWNAEDWHLDVAPLP
jgi:peptide/nickel transport system substrate-binding protein